jgi:ribonuclease H2 subunit A
VLLEDKGGSLRVDWPVDDEDDGMKMTDFFAANGEGRAGDELAGWYGRRVGADVF